MNVLCTVNTALYATLKRRVYSRLRHGASCHICRIASEGPAAVENGEYDGHYRERKVILHFTPVCLLHVPQFKVVRGFGCGRCLPRDCRCRSHGALAYNFQHGGQADVNETMIVRDEEVAAKTAIAFE